MPRNNYQKGGKRTLNAKNISLILAISVLLLFVISFFNDIVSGEIFLYTTQPLTRQDFLPTSGDEVQIAWDVVVVMEDGTPAAGIVGLDDVVVDFNTSYADVQAVLEIGRAHV